MGRASLKRKPPAAPPAARYEDDLFTWVQEQVDLLRAGRLSEVDAGNVAEELSDVGNELYFRPESAIAVLMQHILKWDHQQKAPRAELGALGCRAAASNSDVAQEEPGAEVGAF